MALESGSGHVWGATLGNDSTSARLSVCLWPRPARCLSQTQTLTRNLTHFRFYFRPHPKPDPTLSGSSRGCSAASCAG